MLLSVVYWVWRIIYYAIYFYGIAMTVYVLMSWFPGAYDSALGRFLGRIVQPFLGWFQRFIPPIVGVDLSPIAAWAVLYLFEKFIDIVYFNLVSWLA